MTANKNPNELPYYAFILTRTDLGLVVHSVDFGIESEMILAHMSAQLKTLEEKFYNDFKEKGKDDKNSI